MPNPTNERATRWPGQEHFIPRPWMRTVNKVLAKLHTSFDVKPRFRPELDMLTYEMVANFELLISDVFGHGVPGDLVELGTFTGGTAAVIGSSALRHGGNKVFHVYDRFDIQFGKAVDVEKTFIANMKACGVPLPVMHKGDLLDMVPRDLPATIAFAHIDCGFGGDPKDHAAVVQHCLAGIYPRMPKGGIIVLMDYHKPGVTRLGKDLNPGARMGGDAFLADKPEHFEALYGGPCSHGFMRKQ
ncbi:MAG: hypothetical protein JNM62_16575 [Flavobacteriales bacterium]|nr:hypothetical protein [Flavobacteriales bacterium]